MPHQADSTTKASPELSEAQKKAVAFLTRPRLHFAPKSAEQMAAEQKAIKEEEQAEVIANNDVGYTMLDGSIYAGISPSTKQPMYVTANDTSISMDFNQAAKYIKYFGAHGHQDWHVPTKEELNVLFQNREKGALKGTFNLTGLDPDGWYWSSSPSSTYGAWCQRFDDGLQHDITRTENGSVRCVRG